MTFDELPLAEPLLRAVREAGYEEPTPIQAEAIPVMVEGRDLLGIAQTGTGKTAAFSLPLLHRLLELPEVDTPRALVLVPTRELARQVAEAVESYAGDAPLRVLQVYGGAPYRDQLRALKRGVDVVVGTPGRVRDHVERGALVLDAIAVAVLDEADEMLDLGFQEDLDAILGEVPDTRQLALFSATFPRRLRKIADGALRDPEIVRVKRAERDPDEEPRLREVVHVVKREHQLNALVRVLQVEDPTAALVFCQRRDDVDELAVALDRAGFRTEALHGGLSQEQRERVLDKLRHGSVDILVATDVAARGLDIDHLSHVVNMRLPTSPEPYVHRVGRVGRAGRSGTAISIAGPGDYRHQCRIEDTIKRQLPVEPVPSADKLEEAMVRRTRNMVISGQEDDDLDRWRKLTEELAVEIDPIDLAAVALRNLWRDRGLDGEGAEDIPCIVPGERRERAPRPQRSQDGPPSGDWFSIYMGIGKHAGVRPADVFGAVLGETGIPKAALGRIKVMPTFTLFEVASSEAEHVLHSLGELTWKGRRVNVRPDRET